ncbi:phage tail tape measure protein [Bacteroides uniformis]|uniref:phage tail tape measure protein n=1 Tax=Bacteroides uniformis TaxID=820 RepID=UPI0018A8C173|nr:phage tail tape measure protein [Bacteroides uniformis]MDC1896736.1 phage tail tape measure protein [Bacteroides uniformis]MDC1904134.1 phage tail tape measure protein [Bacteroides uniformis]MDC1912110.1 phage tail tape measure protein [Bacteroides uniformis]MDC1916618.1 phage tail tape measure protein [Bacteroides uniformis]MDC1920880.1 phage tail tape measure protein [Bacteroides uniformis]
MAKSDKTVKRGVYLYIDGKEIKNDINSIDLEMKRLQRDIKEMTRGSEEYNRTMAKIQHLQGILKQHRQEIKGITTETKKATVSIGSMVDWFNRFGGVILSVIGFLTGFTLALRAIRDERNKLEESQAGLKALTGLDDDSIAWLTGQAKTLSTTMTKEGLRVRQSAAEILDAFMLVGSAKPELLGDKEALKAVTEEAMRLQAAAKDITLNEAVDSLTLSLNQYGAAADQAGRFTNVLAAGSQAGSANIASQAKAIRNAGTAAASANVPIEQTVALIETLAYRGIKDEVAGTGLKKFFLVLQTGADETNPKIVGLDKALENLKNKNMDAGAIKKMFGEEGYNTASVILQNTEMVKDFTAAVTGTNVAYEQAAINSDTAQAKLEQARNKMKLAAIDLGEKLNPALTVSTNMLTNVLKYLPGLIDWCKKWGGTVLWLSTILLVYATRLKIITAWYSIWNSLTKIATVLNLAYAASMNTLSGYTVTSFGNLRKLSMLMQGHSVLLKSLRTATYLYAAAVQVLHGRVDLAAKSLKAAWTIMSSNPIGLLVTLVLAAATASYKLTQRTKAYYDLNKVNEKITEKSNDEYARQSSLIEQLTTKIHNNNLSNFERKKAIVQLQAIIPDYNAEIDKEGKIINENTEALDRYNAVLATNIELKEAADELDKHRINLMRLQKSPALSDNSPMGSMAREDVRNKISQEEEIVESLTARYKKLVQEKWKALNPNTPKNNPTGGNDGGKCPICGNKPCTCDKNNTSKDKFAQAEADYYRRIADIKRKYLADDKMTQEEYNKQMRDAEIQLLNDKLKVKGLEPSEIQRINDQILDAEIKARDELRRLDEQSAKDEEKRRKEQAEETFSRLDKEYQMQVEAAAMYHYENRTSEEEYFNELRRLQDVYYHKVLNDAAISEEKKNQVREQMRKRNLKDAQKDAEEEKRIEREKFDILSDLAKGFGETMAQFFTDSEVSLKDFLKNILTMSLDALERMMIMAVTERTIKNIGSLGFVGVAKAAGEIALITAAFETAKGLISNFYTGGFTPSGDWNQPQGIVHSNEFVANRFAVANPNLRPIFDAIDVAQRSGNVGNLTAEDIAAVAGSGKSTRTVPAKAPAASATTTTNDPATVAMLIECTRVLRKLKNRLDAPLVAETYVTGKRGINQAQKEYQKLNNNKSRNKQ